jgi:tetratricopeptide (TPR) repeat protein
MIYKNRDRRSLKHMMIILALVLATAGTAWAQSMGGGCYYNPRNAAEAYCSAHGGCPKSGNCYFPDGSFCELWSYYNGTCPGKGYIEQALWNAEVYAFLYGDDYSGYSGHSGYTGYSSYPGYSGQNSVYGATAYSAGYWRSEADRYYLAGSYAEAADMYGRAVQIDPSLAAAWLNMGNSLYFLGRYQESLDAYDNAVKLDPNNASAWQGKGQALLAQNRVDEANNALRKAEELMKR